MIGFGVGSIARGGLTTTGNSVDWSGYAQGGLEGGLLGLSIGSGLGLIGRVAGGALGAGTRAASTTLGQGGSRLAAWQAGGSAFGRTLAREGGKLALAQTPKGIVGGAHGYASARGHGARGSSAWWSAGVGAIGGLADASNATYYAALGAGGGALIGGGVGYVTGDAGYGALRGSQVGGLLGGLYGGYRYARGLADTKVTGDSVWWGGLIGPEAKVGLKAAAFDAAGAVGGGVVGFAASGGDWDVAFQYAGYGQMASGLTLQTSPRLQRWLLKACFAAGTPLLTPEGSKAIEDFRVGDLILSRPELVADGAIQAMVVEEIFVRTGRLWKLRVSGQDIWTTGEHPFHVADEGRWKPVSELQEGERLSGHNEVCGVVEEVYDTGEYASVYNLRVAEYHTYFVGCAEWGFSVWAHNQYDEWLKNFGLDADSVHPEVNRKLRAFYADFESGSRSAIGRSGYNAAFDREVAAVIQAARVAIGKAPLNRSTLADQRGFSFDAIDPVMLSVPPVGKPENAVSRTIDFVHNRKEGRPINLTELNRQINLHLAWINRLLNTPGDGMVGLQQRISGWTEAVSERAHRAVKTLGSPGKGNHWLHISDPRITNDPSLNLVHGTGDGRVNSLIGANWALITPRILQFPSHVNWLEGRIVLQ